MYDTGRRALTNQVTISNLITGNQYKLAVTAVNAIGESLPSSWIAIYAGMAPSQITSLQRLSSDTTSVTIKWMSPQSKGGLPLTKFTVYYDVGLTGNYLTHTIADTF